MLKISNLQFSRVEDIDMKYQFDLVLEPGKIMAVTGRSGAGKSTLLDLIAGFLQPAGGEIILDNNNITNLAPHKRNTSILFQKNNLFEHLSALDNICLGLSPNSRPTSQQTQLARDMLSKVELSGYENRRASTLSGGQMQRVALAREILRKSKLILLDEPFTGLDEETRQIMASILRQSVEKSDRTIILVTHDLDAVTQIVDCTGEVRAGHLNFAG